MYESFYGLEEKPFNLLPDPHYLYMSDGHENAFSHLEYAITENKGFVVITGEIGSGKTTLINFLLQKVPQDVHIGIINNTDITPLQLLKMCCQEFELETAGKDKAELLEDFNQFLLEQYANNNRVVLIIDEAQNLPRKTIEEIRMLSNLEGEKEHLLQIILVGQPELRAKLQAKGLEQLVQRVTVHSHLDGLNSDDVVKYIRHRLKIAGANNYNIFDKDAMEAIHYFSKGIPRLINILCDTSLVFGYADDKRIVDRAVIQSVVDTRQIGGLISEKEEVEEPPSEQPVAVINNEVYQQVQKRLDSFERRMNLIEKIIANLERKLNLRLNKQEKRDYLVLELVKMLKDSMKGRQRAITKYWELRKALEPEAKTTGIFSRLKGKE